MKKIEAIIFDWDMVLCDSADLQVAAEQQTATEMGVDIAAFEWSKFKGWGRTLIAAEVFDDKSPEIGKEYRERVVDTTCNILEEQNLQPIDGTVEFLDYMRWRVGKLAVATSSNRRIYDASVSHFGMQDYFRTSAAHFECIDNKPKPGPYIEVMHRLDVRPENTLIIEDSHSGINAGRYAQAKVLAIPTTLPEEELRATSGAQLVAEDFPHAVHLLQPYLR
jgi:HAD superfamily hydrolase (TIGR01509 family)